MHSSNPTTTSEPKSPSSAGSPAHAVAFIDESEYTVDKSRRLGKGGLGEVFIGQYHGAEIAVKELLVEADTISDETKRSIEREASMMVGLRHPNVVQFLGIGARGYAILMEYMPNRSLFHLLQNGQPIAWEIIVQIAKDITSGLSYLHAKKIVHRDLKSLNVLLGRDLRAKLSDFGMAKVKQDTLSLKSSGGSCGTPAWTAPEVLCDEVSANYKSDIYSLGMVFWELFAKKTPFAGMNPFTLAFKLSSGTREEIPSDTQEPFRAIITQCWKTADLRPKAVEIADTLKGIEIADAAVSIATPPARLSSSVSPPSSMTQPAWSGEVKDSSGDKRTDTQAELELAILRAELAAAIKAKEEEQEARVNAERQAREQEARLAAERQTREQEERLTVERKARKEEARLAAERQSKEQEACLAAKRQAREQEARITAERQAREQEERLTAERKARKEEARLAAKLQAKEQEVRLAAERKAREQEARLAAERQAREKEARLAVQRKAKEEARLAPEIAIFLKLVAEGEQEGVEASLQRNRELALYPSNVTDLSGRTFNNITALQYAVWALDWQMWEMLLPYMAREDISNQLNGMAAGSWVRTYGATAKWLIQNLLTELQVYIDNYDKWYKAKDYGSLNEQWNVKVRRAQHNLPVHVDNEYCHPKEAFDPLPDFESAMRYQPGWRTRKIDEGEWFTATYDGALNFAFARGVRPQAIRCAITSRGCMARRRTYLFDTLLGPGGDGFLLGDRAAGHGLLATRLQQHAELIDTYKPTARHRPGR